MTSAALVAGNSVIVKPAGPTPVIGAQLGADPARGRRAGGHGELPALARRHGR